MKTAIAKRLPWIFTAFVGMLVVTLAILSIATPAKSWTASTVPATDKNGSPVSTFTTTKVELNADKTAYVWAGSISTSLVGQGTPDSPYLIQSAEDWAYFVTTTSADDTAHYKLMCDIAFDATKNRNCPPKAAAFGGTFDGNGHTLYNPRKNRGSYGDAAKHPTTFFNLASGATFKNLTVDGLNIYSGANYESAFFGTINAGATVSHLTFKNAAVTNGDNASNSNIGCAILATNINGVAKANINSPDYNPTVLIENVTVKDAMTTCGNSQAAGGLVRHINPALKQVTFRNCDVEIDIVGVKGASNTAGIYISSAHTGWNSNMIESSLDLVFENCVSRGSITMPKAGANSANGGFIGQAGYPVWQNSGPSLIRSITFTNCTNYTDITVTGENFGSAGGFIGKVLAPVTMTDCANYGSVTGTATAAPTEPYMQCVGGIIGSASGIGNTYGLSMTNCVQNGDVFSTNNAGGLIGMHRSNSTNVQISLTATSVNCNVTGTNNAGGLMGFYFAHMGASDAAGSPKCPLCNNARISSCTAKDNVEHTSAYYYSSNSIAGFDLVSSAINVTVLLGDGTPGSAILHKHYAGKTDKLTADANTYIISNCTAYINGAGHNNLVNNSVYSPDKVYGLSTYAECLANTELANYQNDTYGAVAQLMKVGLQPGSTVSDYRLWKWEEGKPVLINDLLLPTPDDLNRVYDTKVSEVVVYQYKTVNTVDMIWYKKDGAVYRMIDNPPSDAGDYKLVLKAKDASDTLLQEVSREFTISPYTIDMSTLVWDYQDLETPFVYDKTEHTVQVKFADAWINDPAYITVAYTDNAKINAGDYEAGVTITPVNANFAVTGTLTPLSWNIGKTTLDISGLSVENTQVNYNGEAIELPILGMDSLFDKEALAVSYSVTPTDAGTYTVTATLSVGDTTNYSALVNGPTTLTADLTIKPITLSLVAEDRTLTYTGSALTIPYEVFDQEGNKVSIAPVVTITLDGTAVDAKDVVDVGVYTFTLNFGDTPNYSADAVTATLTIEKATPTFVVLGDTECIYDARPHLLEAVASNDGEVTIVYYDADGNIVEGGPLNAGTYLAVISVEGSKNWNASKLEKTIVVSAANDLELTYADIQFFRFTGFATYPVIYTPEGVSVNYTYTVTDKRGNPVDAAIYSGEYLVHVYAITTDGNHYNEADIAVNIERAPTEIYLTDTTLVYDGYIHHITPKMNHGESACTVSYYKNGVKYASPLDVGVYTVVAHFNGSSNYLGASAESTLTILPKEVSVPEYEWIFSENWYYDGYEHKVTLRGVDTDAFYVTYKNNASVNAGEFTATATITPTPNYVLSAGSKTQFTLDWQIKRASFHLNGIILPDATFVYDGEAHNPAIVGTLPAGVKVTFTQPQTDVGTYVVKATFSVDNPANFDTAEIIERAATMTILPASYDMSEFVFADKEVAYDGDTHTIKPDWKLPAGLTYKVTGEGTEIGTYTVTVTFTADSNHIAPNPMTAELHILPLSDKNEKLDIGYEYEGGKPHGSYMSVSKLPVDQELYDTSAIMKGSSVQSIYHFALTLNGVVIDPNGKVTISIPAGDEYKEKNGACIVRIITDKDGNVKELVPVNEVSVVDGYYVFATDDLSASFAIVGKETNVLLIVGICVGGAAVLGGLAFGVVKVVKTRKRDQEDDE